MITITENPMATVRLRTIIKASPQVHVNPVLALGLRKWLVALINEGYNMSDRVYLTRT